jgi:hypothetical protein
VDLTLGQPPSPGQDERRQQGSRPHAAEYPRLTVFQGFYRSEYVKFHASLA